MIRFVPWSEVGTITVSPGDNVVEVGAFELAEGADTLWVRMTNTGAPGPWPWSYGILSFKTDEGQPLGSIKAYNSFDGEVFKLGVGLPPSVRAGVLTFEPRGFNMAWIKQGNPWSLKFEAQSGRTSVSTSYFNRDPVNGVLSPVTAGDNIQLSPTGWLQCGGSGPTDGYAILNPLGRGQIWSKLNGGGRNIRLLNDTATQWSVGMVSTQNSFFIVRESDSIGVSLSPGNQAWTATSDIRLKQDLAPITDGLSKVDSLRAVTGRFTSDPASVSRSFLIAQDVQAVFPEAVDTSNPDCLGLRYAEVIPLLVSALKEAKARIEALEARQI